MAKRTTNYHDGLIGDLRDPVEAIEYLRAAFEEARCNRDGCGVEMFWKAIRNVAEAERCRSD